MYKVVQLHYGNVPFKLERINVKDLNSRTIVLVKYGTLNLQTMWCLTLSPPDSLLTPGVTELVFSQYTTAGPSRPLAIFNTLGPMIQNFVILHDESGNPLSDVPMGSVDEGAGVVSPLLTSQHTNDADAFTLTGVGANTGNVVVVRDAGLYEVSFTLGEIGIGADAGNYQFQLGDSSGNPYIGSGIWRGQIENVDDPHSAHLKAYLDLPADGTIAILLSRSSGGPQLNTHSLSLVIRRIE